MDSLFAQINQGYVWLAAMAKASAYAAWLQWLLPLAVALLAMLAARAVLRRLWPMLLFAALKTRTVLDDKLLIHLRGPARWAATLLAFQGAGQVAAWPKVATALLAAMLKLLWIAILAWSAVALTRAVGDYLRHLYAAELTDGNLKARVASTQVKVFQRLATVAIFLVAAVAGLMSFDSLRGLGSSLLASAGVAGIVVAFAAQKTLGGMVAGIQFALTQPFRIEDVVVVEGEWGRIEEITFSYVVVRIWDERRLIVPLTYFLEKPFQNWTYQSSSILGTVFVECDYTVPMAALRAELQRLCAEDGRELWDGRVAGLQVTGAERGVMTVRAVVSSADASKNWDLRCLVREGLIAWLQANHPQALPKVRLAEPAGAGGPESAAAAGTAALDQDET